MKRSQFAHTIRAAANILNVKEVLVIGSQAVHASLDKIFPAADRSIETDISSLDTKNSQIAADLIDGSIGEASLFQETFGYYAQGVEPATALLPDGWRQRLVPFISEETNGVTAYCLELHDLWVSKALAGRLKDREFCDELLKRKCVNIKTLHERLKKVKGQPENKIENAKKWIK